jgi:hypothetical protein
LHSGVENAIQLARFWQIVTASKLADHELYICTFANWQQQE